MMNDQLRYKEQWNDITIAAVNIFKYLLPLLSGVIMCAGVIRLKLYYKEFGIDINSYLQFDEYISFALVDLSRFITLGLKIVLFLFIVYAVRVLLLIISFKFKEVWNNKFKKMYEFENVESLENEITRIKINNFTPNSFKVKSSLFTLGLVVSVIFPITLYYFKDMHSALNGLSGKLVVLYSIIGVVLSVVYLFFKNIKIKIYLFILLLTAAYFLHTTYSIIDDADQIINGQSNLEVSVLNADSEMVLSTSNTVKFIGKTRNFIFFYLREEEKNSYFVIPAEGNRIKFTSE